MQIKVTIVVRDSSGNTSTATATSTVTDTTAGYGSTPYGQKSYGE